MGQPNPPGDMPLYDGLDSSWNDIVGALPEDKRAELAGSLKSRIDSYNEKIKPWEDLSKSGITPDHANMSVNLFATIENNPRQVLDTIANHLGLTVAEVKQAAQTMDENMDEDDPRISTMQQQIDTLAQIALAQRNQTSQQQAAQQAEAALDKELGDLKKKFGDDIDEDEIIMRMLHKDMTAEQAYEEYSGKVSQLRRTRPAPMLLGSAGAIPAKAIDPTKLDSAGTKNLVAQMLQHARDENRR